MEAGTQLKRSETESTSVLRMPAALVEDMSGFAKAKHVVREIADPAWRADHKSELLERIDNGYVDEDTGQRVVLPHFGRTHLKNVIACGWW